MHRRDARSRHAWFPSRTSIMALTALLQASTSASSHKYRASRKLRQHRAIGGEELTWLRRWWPRARWWWLVMLLPAIALTVVPVIATDDRHSLALSALASGPALVALVWPIWFLLDHAQRDRREGSVRLREEVLDPIRHDSGGLALHSVLSLLDPGAGGIRPARRARPAAGAEAQPGFIRRRQVGQAGSRPALEPARRDLPHGAELGDVLQRRRPRVRHRRRALQIVLSD